MRIFSGMAHRAGKAGASVLFVFKQYACTRITQKQPESLGFQGVLCYSVRIIIAKPAAYMWTECNISRDLDRQAPIEMHEIPGLEQRRDSPRKDVQQVQ